MQHHCNRNFDFKIIPEAENEDENGEHFR
jgi:hypothetical protein